MKMNARIASKEYGRGGKIHFESQDDSKPSPADIQRTQTALGYHPGGYGCYAIDQKRSDDGWRTTWYCYNNCD